MKEMSSIRHTGMLNVLKHILTAQPLPKFATGGLAWEPRPIETIKEKRKYNMHVDVLPTYEPDIYKEIRDGFIKAAAARLDKDVRKGLGALDGHFDI
jgi:hypothetical protein